MIDRPRIGINVDHDWRHYSFCRDSKLPRGTFDTCWYEELGHRLVPAGVILALLLALTAIWATTP